MYLSLSYYMTRVPEFETSKYLISNREFYEFVKDGGYQRKELWTEEGTHTTTLGYCEKSMHGK